MEKIGIAVGHSRNVRGAKNLYTGLTEWQLCYWIVRWLDEFLEANGYWVVVAEDNRLVDKVRFFNRNRVDLAVEIHMDSWRTAQSGHHCLYYPNSVNGKIVAENITRELTHNISRNDRGDDETASKYLLKYTTMPAVIVELCFINNTDDLDRVMRGMYEVTGNVGVGIINGIKEIERG